MYKTIDILVRKDGTVQRIKNTKLDNEEKKLLIELICNEQTHTIIKDHTRYDSEKYKGLEALKVKIKDM